jgi:hypothetical protein
VVSKLSNLLLTAFWLGIACVAWLLLSYDGFCYGFYDGRTPCSLSRHWEETSGWLGFLLIVEFPYVFVAGSIVFFINDAVYRAVVEARARRWLREAEKDAGPPRPKR